MGNRFVKGLLGLMCLAGFTASAQELVPLPPQPEGLAWPTQGWETGEMAPDVAAIVAPMIEEAIAREKSDLMGETRAVVIIHHGKLEIGDLGAGRAGDEAGPDRGYRRADADAL